MAWPQQANVAAVLNPWRNVVPRVWPEELVTKAIRNALDSRRVQRESDANSTRIPGMRPKTENIILKFQILESGMPRILEGCKAENIFLKQLGVWHA